MIRKFVRPMYGWVIFAALAVPFGTAAHFLAEVAGLGHAAGSVIFSTRHVYLLGIGFVAMLLLVNAIGMSGAASERRRRIRWLISTLPDGGTGHAYVVKNVLFQCAFCAATQLAEGDPIRSGNIAAAVAAALLTTIAGAFAIAYGKSRFLRAIACAFDWIVPRAKPSS